MYYNSMSRFCEPGHITQTKWLTRPVNDECNEGWKIDSLPYTPFHTPNKLDCWGFLPANNITIEVKNCVESIKDIDLVYSESRDF